MVSETWPHGKLDVLVPVLQAKRYIPRGANNPPGGPALPGSPGVLLIAGLPDLAVQAELPIVCIGREVSGDEDTLGSSSEERRAFGLQRAWSLRQA